MSCDESKCVSKGRSDLHNDSFTCYGDDGTFYPMMCADGYLPLVFEDENDFRSNVTDSVDGSIPVSYFTCCPPQHQFFSDETDAVRRCSDPITVLEAEWKDDEIIDAICQDDSNNRTDARRTKYGSHGGTGSFLCCDSLPTDGLYLENDEFIDHNKIIIDATILPKEDFLETLECVPYRNEFYQASNAQNQLGATNAQNQVAMLRPISCDTPEHDFLIPRPFGNETLHDVASTGRYQCCRDGPSLPPFAPDYAYRITIYPAFCLFCVAAFLSAIAGIGLLIPLLIQLSQGRLKKGATENQENGEPRYNTYNLYLVYLMAVDLVYCIFQICLYGRTILQKFDPSVHGYFIPPTTQDSLMLDPFVEQPYFFVSVWLNCIICYQILFLLKSSQTAHRAEQPSLKRVSLQAGIICLFSLIIGSSSYVIENAIQKAEVDGNFETKQILLIVSLVFGTLLGLPPILYMLNGACIIWWRGYIPSLSIGGTSESDRAMRELAFYFFRIIVVFLGTFLPVMGLILYAAITDEIWVYMVMSCLMAIKPTLTFYMILTKPDARNYILRLVTLSYLFDEKSCLRKCREEKETTPNKNWSQDRSKTSRTTKISYGDFNRDIHICSKEPNAEKQHTKADVEAGVGAESSSSSSKGRYIYTSRRIPGLAAAILPTGEMVSVAVDTGSKNAMVVSPGTSTIDTTRITATFSSDEDDP